MPPSIFQDISFLQLVLIIASVLLLLSFGRMFSLARDNKKLAKDSIKMNNWAVTQQAEITTVHHDAQSWRAKTQRQFDALRADLSARLEQAERGNDFAQKKLDASQEKALAAAHATIADLEAQLARAKAAPRPAPAPAPVPLPNPFSTITPAPAPAASIPSLPAMDTLRVESLSGELAAAKAEVAVQRQHNAELQRALLLARRKHPAARKNGSRMARHS